MQKGGSHLGFGVPRWVEKGVDIPDSHLRSRDHRCQCAQWQNIRGRTFWSNAIYQSLSRGGGNPLCQFYTYNILGFFHSLDDLRTYRAWQENATAMCLYVIWMTCFMGYMWKWLGKKVGFLSRLRGIKSFELSQYSGHEACVQNVCDFKFMYLWAYRRMFKHVCINAWWDLYIVDTYAHVCSPVCIEEIIC